MALENFLDTVIIFYNRLGGGSLKLLNNNCEYSSGIFFCADRKSDYFFKTASILTAPLIHLSYVICESCCATFFLLTALGNYTINRKQDYSDDLYWSKECLKSTAMNFIAIFLSTIINLIDFVLTIMNAKSNARYNNSSTIPIHT